ncbi:MAG: winged helix-turn-helix domain-containing protein [Anaerolineales bacterium]|nr:winged helix-turn-helix domain-containing protein [Anaerolineales bacterium]
MSDYLEPSGGGRFPPGFRQEVLGCLRQWLAMRASVSLVGLPGAGKSNLLQYIYQNPESLTGQQTVVLVTLDLNHLVDGQPTTLYRLVLRACYHVRSRFPQDVADLVAQLYESHKATTDLFLAQTAVYDLLAAVAQQRGLVVLILDQFDRFCRRAEPELTLCLRALRDGFKDTTLYIVGMRQAPLRMAEPELLGELLQLLDTHVCWVGAMSWADSFAFVKQEVGRVAQAVTEAEAAHLFSFTGGYPSLLKAACAWLVRQPERPSVETWFDALRLQPTIKNRLGEIWRALTQEEQWLLAELSGGAQPDPASISPEAMTQMVQRGLCQHADHGCQVRGDLLADYVQTAVQHGLGRIWRDSKSGVLYQGTQRVVGLRPLEEALLTFLVQNPYKPHTKTALIQAVWPEGTHIVGVTDDSLYQVVRGVRQKIEPKTAESPVYLVTKRGVDEGGYQFFPEGSPES